ncbi:MAG TPA: cupredoxin family copper-binding protein [Longimicrobiales bacterium]
MAPGIRTLTLLTLLAMGVAPARAQSVLDRAPNVSDGWIGARNSIYFNFLHRFNHSGAPQRQITNRPTFVLAWRSPLPLLIGTRYGTRSDIVPRVPNEWELFARYGPLRQDGGAPVDGTVQAAWNEAARSVDGEATLARRQGPLRLIAAARVLGSAFDSGETRFALAAGATLRLTRWIALAGDYAQFVDLEDDEDAAWGAAVQIALPYTPHSLSLQATNTNTATIHGASRGADDVRWGFEFTVPISLGRWFGSRATAAAERTDPPTASVPDPADVRVTIRNLAYMPPRIEVDAGTTIEWRNEDQVDHTVTAVNGNWDSGIIRPGATWRRTFDTPGSYDYFCTPHPFMKAIVVVRPAP